MSDIQQRIKTRAIELAKEDLGSEYGYMGAENAGHYVLASMEVISELDDRVKALEEYIDSRSTFMRAVGDEVSNLSDGTKWVVARVHYWNGYVDYELRNKETGMYGTMRELTDQNYVFPNP